MSHDSTSVIDEAQRLRVSPFWALVVLVPLLALLAFGAYGHWRTDRDATAVQQGTAAYVPSVDTLLVHSTTTPIRTSLPGQTDAYSAADIYARATGYVAERHVDIGSTVKRGDLLLRIAAPDLDQELAQAQAQLGQVQAALVQARANVDEAEANQGLANVTNRRTTTLADEGWATQQYADTTRAQASSTGAAVASARAAAGVAEANVRAQQATVNRFKTLQSFETITAPFDGVVTARNVEVGDLVNADQGGTPLFTVERQDVLRVVVAVPQSDAIGIRTGLQADVIVSEYPGRTFAGLVSRTAGALADNSRSMRVEVDVPNPDALLRPGLYVDVTFRVPRTAPVIVIPDTALMFTPDGMQVAVVGADNKVTLRPVTLARDQGTRAELTDGLRDGERIVNNPPPDLETGSSVKSSRS